MVIQNSTVKSIEGGELDAEIWFVKDETNLIAPLEHNEVSCIFFKVLLNLHTGRLTKLKEAKK